ncbi:unnamed protein product [Medioppia subpectinata]|uniref:C2H2-type domain-containing protein n=1 Tax=Medioppia subpectinata TaxID=1979941 RepID=A0A7R9KJ15_9ACAR|nr:unnamed protein product [Medioppia subpectinata]CAG2104391.1 unnamed protein product [Medioppia subpectinata]
MMESSATIVPQMSSTVPTAAVPTHSGQSSADGCVLETTTTVNTSADPYNGLNCEPNASLMLFNQNNNQLLNTMIVENSYKSDESLTERQSTDLTFSDLTPPVPNISQLESNQIMQNSDPSQPTFDGVSGAVPQHQIQQMNTIATESPQIEIPNNEIILPSMAPKNNASLMESVNDNQYSNLFEPVINGPSGSAPQTPAASPIAAIEQNVNMSNGSMNPQMTVLSSFGSNNNTFDNTTVASVSADMFNQMVPVLNNNNNNDNNNVSQSEQPLPVLSLDPALQEQLLDAIPPPSVNFPPGPVPTDEKGIPTALPGEFPLSLLPVEEEKVGGIESASVPLDKIEATINMNSKSIPTLTDAISLSQSQVNLIKSLPQPISAQQPLSTLSNISPNAVAITVTDAIAANNCGLETVADQQFGQYDNNIGNQSHMSSGLPPPPPLQPVQNVNQTTMSSMPEMNTLTNLVPVVEPTDPSIQQTCRQALSVVIKSEPQSYSEAIDGNNGSDLLLGLSKVNDDNNNPILNNLNRQKGSTSAVTRAPTLVNNQIRSFPLCVISTAPTPLMSKSNASIVTPKYELPLPPKKARFATTTSSGLVSHQLIQSHSSAKMSPSAHASAAVPSTGMIYDLPLHQTHHSSNPSTTFRVQSDITHSFKAQHNMTPPFTTVAPILLSGLMPSVSVAIDGPLSLVKEEKMRQLITTNALTSHPDFPAISGLLSFINPYHKPTTASVTTCMETPLSLSVKNSLSGAPVTANPLIQSHSLVTHASHVPSLTRPSLHHNQSITSATTLVPTPPTAVPVSVVTSVVDHQNRGVPQQQRIKAIAQNSNKHRLNVEHNTTGATGVKLQLAPLLSGDPAKPFQCALCGKHLASKNVYQLHLRSHSGEKPFTCNLCGHSFSQKTSLTRHMRSHTGERPFPCQVCGKRFADKERIKIHMRTHTGEKPFACDICGKQFSQKSTVKRHMSVHTGEKPFKCETCGKGFANRGNLTAHTKTHSNS